MAAELLNLHAVGKPGEGGASQKNSVTERKKQNKYPLRNLVFHKVVNLAHVFICV